MKSRVGMESSETMRILEEEYDLVEKFPVCLGQDEPWHLYNKERDQARLVPTWHMDNTDLPPAGHYWSPRVRMYKRKAEYDLPQKDGPKNLV
jgi:hypothetical protein